MCPKSKIRFNTDWENVYDHSADSGGWSYLSGIIVRTLVKEIGSPNGISIIEIGCGSGRNSAGLAELGANVTLLDLSEKILTVAKTYFNNKGLKGSFVQGDMFAVPFPDNSFQVVWNAGVIEHWKGDKQVHFIREMLRICQSDGTVITLNPNKFSIHELGKKVLTLLKIYPYHDEYNIVTLKDQVRKAGGKLGKKEYSFGFLVLFVGFFFQLRNQYVLGRVSYKIFLILNGLMTWLDRSSFGNQLYQIDKWFSKVLGGYLLVSVMQKKIL